MLAELLRLHGPGVLLTCVVLVVLAELLPPRGPGLPLVLLVVLAGLLPLRGPSLPLVLLLPTAILPPVIFLPSPFLPRVRLPVLSRFAAIECLASAFGTLSGQVLYVDRRTLVASRHATAGRATILLRATDRRGGARNLGQAGVDGLLDSSGVSAVPLDPQPQRDRFMTAGSLATIPAGALVWVAECTPISSRRSASGHDDLGHLLGAEQIMRQVQLMQSATRAYNVLHDRGRILDAVFVQLQHHHGHLAVKQGLYQDLCALRGEVVVRKVHLRCDQAIILSSRHCNKMLAKPGAPLGHILIGYSEATHGHLELPRALVEHQALSPLCLGLRRGSSGSRRRMGGNGQPSVLRRAASHWTGRGLGADSQEEARRPRI
mmetsp:Transcript_109858/g.309832  ORF Transcript_109858/g.309832 Transcript_109858/m.309832 type:complete len:376 (-) Transcript_109858:109-1236(-)